MCLLEYALLNIVDETIISNFLAASLRAAMDCHDRLEKMMINNQHISPVLLNIEKGAGAAKTRTYLILTIRFLHFTERYTLVWFKPLKPWPRFLNISPTSNSMSFYIMQEIFLRNITIVPRLASWEVLDNQVVFLKKSAAGLKQFPTVSCLRIFWMCTYLPKT